MPQHDPKNDARMMRRALALARRGAGRVSPNPMVGAVLARGGLILAEGWHHRYGGEHAEVEALRRAGEAARGADLYVNLEPCSHYGQTPPCSDAIIRAGVRRVVAAMIDPNPRVSGRGLRALRRAGIEVELGLLEASARRLNEGFIRYMESGRPFVVAKAAVSLDGKLATKTGDSGQERGGLSGESAHRYAHQLRRELDAILVGAGTVRRDDPRLTCRLPGAVRQPLRIVLDGAGQAPPAARVFDTSAANTLVISTRRAPAAWRAQLRARGVEVWLLPGRLGCIDPRDLLQELGRRAVTSLLVEGGSAVLGGFLKAGAIDRLDLILTPAAFGGRDLPLFGGEGVAHLHQAYHFRFEETRRLGLDLLLRAYPEGRSGCSPG